MKLSSYVTVLTLAIGIAAVPLASAQVEFQLNETNETNQTDIDRYIDQDAILLYDEVGEYMAITFNDDGELLGTSGTVQSIDELDNETLTVCLYQSNVNQDFVDLFQPTEGFFEGELLGDPLTDDEIESVEGTATCYESGGGLFS